MCTNKSRVAFQSKIEVIERIPTPAGIFIFELSIICRQLNSKLFIQIHQHFFRRKRRVKRQFY